MFACSSASSSKAAAFALLLLVLWAEPAAGQIAIEDTAIGATPIAVAPAGASRVLYAIVSEDAVVDQNFTCTFNTSESMTQLSETTGTGQYLAVFRLISPTATSADIACAGASGADSIAAIALSGVDQVTPNDAIAAATETASGDPISSPVVSSESGDLVVGGHAVNNKAVANTTPTGTSQVQHEEFDVAGGGQFTTDISTTPGAASVTQSWDFNTAARASAYAFNVNAAGGAPPTGTAGVGLIGVGR